MWANALLQKFDIIFLHKIKFVVKVVNIAANETVYIECWGNNSLIRYQFCKLALLDVHCITNDNFDYLLEATSSSNCVKLSSLGVNVHVMSTFRMRQRIKQYTLDAAGDVHWFEINFVNSRNHSCVFLASRFENCDFEAMRERCAGELILLVSKDWMKRTHAFILRRIIVRKLNFAHRLTYGLSK